jgi:hypothetical protein
MGRGFCEKWGEINHRIFIGRYDIPVVNEENAQIFIDGLINDGYSYNKNDMAEEFIIGFSQKNNRLDIYELMDLFIDFDNKRLYSVYIESIISRICS